MKATTLLVSIAAICSIALTSGCSGGGDESPTEEISNRASQANVTTNDANRIEPKSEHCGDPVEINAQMLEHINQVRASAQVCRGQSHPAVPALQLDALLENSAIVHADDMASNNFLSHTGSDGSSSGNRADRQGYDWIYISENLGGNYRSVSDVADAWMDSSAGHCEVIMSARATDLGVACVYNENSDYEYYWALELGTD
jgi:uncharacterized protein YkwD